MFAALPYAVWFYLAIEGVAMVAEEVKEPQEKHPERLYNRFDNACLAGLRCDDFYRGVNRLAQIKLT